MANKTIIAVALLQGLQLANGKKEDIKAGETCEVDAAIAKWAVDGGHAEYDRPIPANKTTDPVTLEQFKAAVATLEEGNAKHWTNDGRPDCNALAAAGCEVKAAERDAFWEEINMPA